MELTPNLGLFDAARLVVKTMINVSSRSKISSNLEIAFT